MARKDRSYLMKISARNQLKGMIVEMEEGAVNGIVTIEIPCGCKIKASITNAAIHDLGLEVGKEAIAIIKASSVMFASDRIPNISARNQLKGKLVEVEEGAVNGIVTIELRCGYKIKGSITNQAIEQLGLEDGGDAVAVFKASEVMVGIE